MPEGGAGRPFILIASSWAAGGMPIPDPANDWSGAVLAATEPAPPTDPWRGLPAVGGIDLDSHATGGIASGRRHRRVRRAPVREGDPGGHQLPRGRGGTGPPGTPLREGRLLPGPVVRDLWLPGGTHPLGSGRQGDPGGDRDRPRGLSAWSRKGVPSMSDMARRCSSCTPFASGSPTVRFASTGRTWSRNGSRRRKSPFGPPFRSWTGRGRRWPFPATAPPERSKGPEPAR